MSLEVLGRLGLSTNEAKVYIALLRLGTAAVTEITKKSGVYRSNVYDALEKLMERGLVATVTKSNKKYFEVAHPNALYGILKIKEEELKGVMPGFLAEYNEKKEKQDIYLFKGGHGVKTVLQDMNQHKSYDAFGISSNLAKVVPHYFPHWIRERVRKKRFGRMIKTKGDPLRTPHLIGLKGHKKLWHVKELPPRFYTPAATFIYGNKVAIILEKASNPVAVLIENKEIADGYRKQFNALWQIAEEESLECYKATQK